MSDVTETVEITQPLAAQGDAPDEAPAEAVAAPAPTPAHRPISRKMVIAAFVLGIVGTSLAVLSLILCLVNLGRSGHSGRMHDRVSISEDFNGPAGRMTERFQEDFGGRGGRMTERFEEDFTDRPGTDTDGRRGRGDIRERLEITEDDTDQSA